MNRVELNHVAIQRLIIITLGVLTFAVMLQSCGKASKACAAYDHIEVEETK